MGKVVFFSIAAQKAAIEAKKAPPPAEPSYPLTDEQAFSELEADFKGKTRAEIHYDELGYYELYLYMKNNNGKPPPKPKGWKD